MKIHYKKSRRDETQEPPKKTLKKILSVRGKKKLKRERYSRIFSGNGKKCEGDWSSLTLYRKKSRGRFS